MAKHILRCSGCGRYSMAELCSCGKGAVPAKPPKYSVEDKYARFRREAKKDELKKRGLI